MASWVGDHAGLSQHQRIADLGCGEGASLRWWRDAYGVAEVIGYEPDQGAARRASQRCPEATIVASPARSVRDQRDLDAVLAVDAAYHFDHDRLFEDVARAVRPGGVFVATDFVRSDRGGRWGAVAVRAGAKLFRFGRSVPLDRDRMKGRLTAAGFELEAYEDLSTPVLIGFADHVRDLEADGRLTGPGTKKLRMTAAAARLVRSRDLVRYVGFAARRIR